MEPSRVYSLGLGGASECAESPLEDWPLPVAASCVMWCLRESPLVAVFALGTAA
jgi:hypothetical protein